MALFKQAKKKDDDVDKDNEKRAGADSDAPSEPSEDDFAKAGLSEAQTKTLKDQTGYTNDAKATIFAVYRYAIPLEFAMIAVSAVCSIAAGMIAPLMIIIFGQLVGDLSNNSTASIGEAVGGNSAGNQNILYLVYLAIASFSLEWIATVGWQQTGRRIARKVREEYLRALMKQNIGFFDSFGAGKMTSHITADMNAIQEAISEKVGITLSTLATFVGAFIVGFIQYWALALILSSALLAIMLFGGLVSVPMQSSGKKAGEAGTEAATVVDEAFSAIKTVLALNMQERIKDRYATHTRVVEHWSGKSKTYAGLMLAIMMCIINLMYGLAFWQGSRFDNIDIAKIIITLMAIMVGSFSVAMMAPNFAAFSAGNTSAVTIFRTIDRVSPIDSSGDDGLDASQISGEIEFKGVRHVYPSRVTTNALSDYNLHISAGKTTALVGPSGGGKSTVVGLLQRFYNIVEGSITIDGVNITDYNIGSLRHQISVVSQEPILFDLSLRDNIAFGLPDAQRKDFTEQQITDAVVKAAKQAYAHDFVSRLPQGYDTPVGERGVLLSGGQRQRIAIARALVSEPKILLFDEATSALDVESERYVQAAIQEASRHRTTIMIAHRLSTIRDADSIAVIIGGKVCEQGTHSELLALNGTYKKLVDAQALTKETGEDEPARDPEKAALVDEEVLENELFKTISPTKTRNIKPSILQRVGTSRSATDVEKSGHKAEGTSPERQYSWWDVIKFLYHYNRQEKWLLLIGCALSIISGMVQPVGAVLFAKSIFAIVAPDLMAFKINFWAAMYLLVGFVALFALAGRSYVFGIASARLTARLRTTIFDFALKQEAEWFDTPAHSAGALTSMLSTEPENAAAISGATLGTLIDGAITLFGGMILALAIGWKLALVCISVVPVILVSGFVRVALLAKFQVMAKKTFEESAASASEYIAGIRTVASLSKEKTVWQAYHDQLIEAERKSIKWVILSSLFFAMSQASQFLIFALVFWYGGKLIGSGEYGPQQFFICLAAVIFGAQSAANFFGFGPDITKTRIAGERLLQLLSTISTEAKSPKSAGDNITLQGHIQLKNVNFSYPGRSAIVIDGLDLDIPAGSFVALVGHSGCGKSTVISLASRLYHPTSGSITVDGTNLEDLDTHILRTQLSVVAQEPVLFSGTIRENLLMGLPLHEKVSEERIHKACQDANIDSLISSLPEGYNTALGNKGVQLSGGQRQRIAIARTLLRNPKILLLDEATSALDSESEHLVQQALDKVIEGRTTISVAHRLSTIQKADKIFVLQAGKLVESGTHSELLQRKGRYSQFVKEQDLGSKGA